MLEEALTYPMSGERGVGRVLIGGVLSFFWFLVVPALLVYGYFIRALGARARGEGTLPEFEDWGGMLVDGLKGIVIGIAYGIVPFAIVFVIAFVAGLGGAASDSAAASGAFTGLSLIASLLSFVVSIVVSYVLMAAMANFAVEGRIGAAFDFDTIKRVITSDQYIMAFVLFVGIEIAISILALIVLVITFGLAGFLYLIVGPFFAFWFNLVAAYLFGTAYWEATGSTGDTDDTGNAGASGRDADDSAASV